MKKLISLVVLVACFFFGKMAYSSDTIQALLFPVKLLFNGEQKTPGEAYSILNYKGHTYVPIRFVAETMGANVTYDEAAQSIEIKYNDYRLPSLAAVSSSRQEAGLLLKVNSERMVYKQNEPLKLWAQLSVTGDSELTVSHGTPLMHFYMDDKQGNRREEAQFDYGPTEVIKKGNEYLYLMPSSFVKYFNIMKNGYNDDIPNINQLEKGDYIMGVVADISIVDSNGDENRKYISSDFIITIE
ncbi:stalk domain-containing protein [Paenibacillus sp. y28]|uniref:stalk domain-containing protein n=1 Tax=Paenibacillus sp. y28 TaxID=3129110 RepID=UPI0030173B51